MVVKSIKERANRSDIHCPVAYTLSVIGGKWHLPIIWSLHQKGVMRYNELRRELDGITAIMLTQSLKDLEQLGLVARTQYNEVPPRVEYSLTEEGQSLFPALAELAKWGRKRMEREHVAEVPGED